MEQFLEWIDDGGVLRNVFGYLLRAIGGILVLVAAALSLFHLYQWFKVFELPWVQDSSVMEAILNTIQTLFTGPIYIGLQVLLYYLVIKAIFLRSENILELENTGYTVIPIFTQVLRLLGDLSIVSGLVMTVHYFVYAGFNVVKALFDSIFDVGLVDYGLLFAAHESGYGMRSIMQTTFPVMGQYVDPWWSVVLLLAGGIGVLLGAALIQLFYYLIAELMIVLVDIAQNTSGDD